MKNVLDNKKHIIWIRRWAEKKGYSLDELSYFCSRLLTFGFPEYRDDPQFEEKIKTILTVQ